MIATAIRTIIMYLLTIVAMRLMGKRQIGELKPSELVTTILISNLASLPIEDTQISIFMSITPILIIVSIEIIFSAIEAKSAKFSSLVTGDDKIVIKNGRVNQRVMNELRYTMSDIVSALRAKDCFDIADVEFAVVETNGTINVFKKNDADEHPMIPIVMDCDYYTPGMSYCDMDRQSVDRMLRERQLRLKTTLLLQISRDDRVSVVEKEAI